MTVFNWVFQGGKLNQEVTSVTLVNNTAKTVDATVPSNKRWLLLSIRAVNMDNVSRTVTFYVYKEAAATNLIAILSQVSVGTLLPMQWPNALASATTLADISPSPHVVILDAGNTIRIIWSAGGASAGSVDADGLVICYLEVDA